MLCDNWFDSKSQFSFLDSQTLLAGFSMFAIPMGFLVTYRKSQAGEPGSRMQFSLWSLMRFSFIVAVAVAVSRPGLLRSPLVFTTAVQAVLVIAFSMTAISGWCKGFDFANSVRSVVFSVGVLAILLVTILVRSDNVDEASVESLAPSLTSLVSRESSLLRRTKRR